MRRLLRRWSQSPVRAFAAPSASRLFATRKRLRPYQQKALAQARAIYDDGGASRLLFPMATGLGKTVLFSHLPQRFPELASAGTLVLVHRDVLVRQTVAAFEATDSNLRIGVEQGEHTADPHRECLDVVIASVQTLSRQSRLQKFQDWGGIIVVDEAHHMRAGNSYDEVMSFFWPRQRRVRLSSPLQRF